MSYTAERSTPADAQAWRIAEWDSERTWRQVYARRLERLHAADEAAFSVADAADAEAAAAVSARKGGGLVSVSTTHTRSSRGSVEGQKRLARAQSQARAHEAGVYVPPAREDGVRVRKLRRAVGFAARAHGVSARGHRDDDCLMVTLTYRQGGDWRPSHLRQCMTALREWMRRRSLPLRYVWVAELQQRGAIHYHIALFVPRGFRLPMFDVQGWWPHGSTRIEKAVAAVPYLMKYLSKGEDKKGAWRLPEGARMYGIGGLEHSLRRARRWLGLPAFVQSRSDWADDWRRIPGVAGPAACGGHPAGWGEWPGDGMGPPKFWPSEFKRCRVGQFMGFERVHDHGRPFEASGPFSWWRK